MASGSCVCSEHGALLFEKQSGRLIGDFCGSDEIVGSAAFSPDGTKIVLGTWYKRPVIWDLATGAKVQELHDDTGDFSF